MSELPTEPFETNAPTGKRRIIELIKKPWFIVLFTGIVVVIVAGLCADKIMKALLHSREEVVVPDLVGKSLMDSLETVSSLNLSLRQERTEFDEGRPAGTVVDQHPPAGIRVREGRPIVVVTSKGGQVVFVPNVIGRPITEAQSMLSGERLQMGAVSQMYSVDYKEGLVIGQSPSSGTMVTRGALVDVQLSKGLPPAGAPLLPDFTGQTADQVRSWADGVSAQIKISEDAKAMGVSGTVVKQDPPAGQPLLEGTILKVTLVPLVSDGGGRFVYRVPADSKGEVTVRILARDSRGESEIYKGVHKAGDSVELPITVSSATRIRVYVDEILQEEKVMEP